MGIVCVILPGVQQRAFANALHKATGGGVDLIVITKPRLNTDGRVKRISAAVRSGAILRELWYGALLRMSRKTRGMLSYLRASSFTTTSPEYDDPVLRI